jgi:hypothetical protein
VCVCVRGNKLGGLCVKLASWGEFCNHARQSEQEGTGLKIDSRGAACVHDAAGVCVCVRSVSWHTHTQRGPPHGGTHTAPATSSAGQPGHVQGQRQLGGGGDDGVILMPAACELRLCARARVPGALQPRARCNHG